MTDIVLLDLFSGIGGFSQGLSDAGFRIVKHMYSEIDKHAIANYKYNFKNSEYVGSVTTLDGRTITRPNIITFGSPCQDFSVAGKRAGMGGERSSLIGQAIRLIAECRPDVFIWENVKGVFSSNSGADFWGVIQAFTNIGGYRLEWQLLNTAWVLPQNRERVYLVGHLATAGRDFKGVFPFREDDYKHDELQVSGKTTNIRTLQCPGHSGGYHSGMTLVRHRSTEPYKEAECSPALRNSDKAEVRIIASRGRGDDNEQQLEQRDDGVTNALTGVQKDNMVVIPEFVIHGVTKEGFKIGTYRTHKDGQGFRETQSGLAPTIPARAREDGSGQPIVFAGGLNPHNRGDGSLSRDYSEQDRVYDAELSEQSATIAATSNSKYLHNSQIRRLTEVECERLQGFPDGWTEFGNYDGVVKKIPKTQRYKLLGNAVTKTIVEAIGIRLLAIYSLYEK